MLNKVNGKLQFQTNHLIGILLTVLAVLTLASSLVMAAEDNAAYEVVRYDYHAMVNKNHSYQVVEKIAVDLPTDVETISFVVPSGNYRVYELKVEGAEYKRTKNEDENIISIVDADKLTKGQHTYKIEYIIKEFSDRDSEKDMFYFDVLPPSWTQPISNLNIKVDFPEDFPWSDVQYYAGQYGVQDVNTKLNYKSDEADKSISIKGNRIPANFGITVKAQLPEGYWDGALDGTWTVKIIFIMGIALVLVMFLMWLIGGRDPKIKKVVQTHPVDGVTPAEIGYIFNTRVGIRDIITLIVYFGTKGYLSISEYAPKKYKLIKKQSPDSEEKFVRTAYSILFEDTPDGRWVDMDDLGDRLVKVKNKIEEDIAAGFSSNEMSAYTPLSKAFRTIGIILTSLVLGVVTMLKYNYVYTSINFFEVAIVVGVTAILLTLLCRQYDRQTYSESGKNTIILSAIVVAYIATIIYVALSGYRLTGAILPVFIVLVASILNAFLIAIMRARAKGNATLASRFRQLRHFIYHPTANILAENYFEDNNYYYEILPYALHFNGLDTWAISFLTLGVPAPDWYSDDIEGHAFSSVKGQATIMDYAKDIRTFSRTIEDAYHSMERRHKK